MAEEELSSTESSWSCCCASCCCWTSFPTCCSGRVSNLHRLAWTSALVIPKSCASSVVSVAPEDEPETNERAHLLLPIVLDSVSHFGAHSDVYAFVSLCHYWSLHLSVRSQAGSGQRQIPLEIHSSCTKALDLSSSSLRVCSLRWTSLRCLR